VDGYLTASSRAQLYLFEVKSKKLEPLTTDKNFEDRDPVWSPDSTHIAFVSNHEKDPDQVGTEDIFVVEARPGSSAVKLTDYRCSKWATSGLESGWENSSLICRVRS